MTCSVGENCFNNGSCFNCCFDDDHFSEYGSNLYNPKDRKIKHPILVERKSERKNAKRESEKREKAIKRENQDQEKRKISKAAAAAEQKVKSTLNSGRVSMDGDLRSDELTIDVKLQTTSKDWHVKREEYLKVQNDAARANRDYGILAITNKLGETVYVIPEELFKVKFI